MYLATHSRAANAYRQVSTATRVNLASGPQLVSLLFDALRVHLLQAENAVSQNQVLEGNRQHVDGSSRPVQPRPSRLLAKPKAKVEQVR